MYFLHATQQWKDNSIMKALFSCLCLFTTQNLQFDTNAIYKEVKVSMYILK